MLKMFQIRKARLKWLLDRRFMGVWMGPLPRLLDKQELEPGDVLFCAPRLQRRKYARWISRLIQTSTDGVYTHCGVYLGFGRVADSNASGVRIVTLEEFEEHFRYLAVARCPGITSKRARAIRLYAHLCWSRGARYNFLGALLLPLREYYWLRHYYAYALRGARKPVSNFNKFRGKGLFFCSEFVVQCFKACGYIPQNDRSYQSHIWTPTGLAEENIFTLVGYRSTEGLQSVSKSDPFLGGCHYVLKHSNDY
jgi:hypothetical protein